MAILIRPSRHYHRIEEWRQHYRHGAGADPTTAVGTFPLVPSLVDPGGKLGNYAVTSNNGTLTIGPAALSVIAANAARAYGSPNPIFTG